MIFISFGHSNEQSKIEEKSTERPTPIETNGGDFPDMM
jgi:hypothetical protein